LEARIRVEREGTLRLFLALVVACPPLSAQEPAPKPRADAIEFAVISPSSDTVLERGKPVTVEATVEYELVSKDAASIRVLALDGSGRPFAGFEPTKVSKGRSVYKCAGTVKVPKRGEVLLLVAQLYDLVPLSLPDKPLPEKNDQSYALLQEQMLKVRLPAPLVSLGSSSRLRRDPGHEQLEAADHFSVVRPAPRRP
jgi:hypothetical protein